LKVLIIGAGLIGQERIAALLKISLNFKIKIDITVVDKNENQLKAIQEKYDLNISKEINEELVKNPDWIFISTPHAVAPEILFSSFRYCNNILVEKPLGRNLKECMKVTEVLTCF
jgi:predicted dehydrogenase